ncbi:MAG: hypothetical protein INR71_04440 [Terriglobus roseus]|nr:hypothetical protein [Terriglobus roseus]
MSTSSGNNSSTSALLSPADLTLNARRTIAGPALLQNRLQASPRSPRKQRSVPPPGVAAALISTGT